LKVSYTVCAIGLIIVCEIVKRMADDGDTVTAATTPKLGTSVSVDCIAWGVGKMRPVRWAHWQFVSN